jgi:sulfoxide reductase heme-binding subunit YedZ
MIAIVASTGPSPVWYVARGSGLAALVVLTVSMLLGIITSVRWTNPRWPRFVIELVHRNSSLLAFGLIAVHAAAVVVDAFAPIGWKDTVVPFAAGYRTVWLGLGAAALDVLVAVLVTSLLRHRMSHQTWRLVHWFSYLCWPLVVVHGLGTGSDTKLGWVLALYVGCVAAVILAAWWRLAFGWPHPLAIRVAGLAATVVAPIVLVTWLAAGPLAAGWARRAGTPASLLAPLAPAPAGSAPPASTPPSTGAEGLATPPFSAQLAGTIRQSGAAADGSVTVRLAASLSGGATGVVDIDLTGPPVQGGGILMDTSRVTLGPAWQPGLYQGTVGTLRGDRLVAEVRSAGRPPLHLAVTVQPDPASGQLTGSLRATTQAGVG